MSIEEKKLKTLKNSHWNKIDKKTLKNPHRKKNEKKTGRILIEQKTFFQKF